jgi:hypothetical protein
LQGRSDAADLSNLTKSVSSGETDTLNSNPVVACDELYASIEGNDCDEPEPEPEPEPIASKAPVTKKWYAGGHILNFVIVLLTRY